MSQSSVLFFQFATVLGLAAGLGLAVKLLRLPLVVAYLLAGVTLSLLPVFNITTFQNLTFLPDIGIALVLFFVGMELDLKEVKSLGKPILAAALGQILIAFLTGFQLASIFGFPPGESFYLGIGLSFSSTIVVIKLLLEKKDLGSLYGKLSLGILLVEDLVAIMVLMAMTMKESGLSLGLTNSLPLIMFALKGISLGVATFVLARFILGRIFAAVARSAELLFLSSLAWCFIFITISLFLGFSVVIGAFLAGLALANSPFHYEIAGKVRSVRDLFVTLFFVYLGSQVVFEDLSTVWPLIAAFTAYALIIKPIIFLLILGSFGFRRHAIFQTAVNLSQISEFSLIIMVVGVRMGVVSQASLTAMALTGVISIISSSILISYSRQIYKFLLPFVAFFEHRSFTHKTESKKEVREMEEHVILIGAHRIGGEVVKFLKRESIPFLVLDFNPEVVQRLTQEKVHALYGDVGDPEILEFLNLEKAKLLISTADNIDDNLVLLAELTRRKVKAVTMVRASSVTDAEILYAAGADDVILPEIVSGDFVTQVLQNHWPNMHYFKDRAEVELRKLSRNHLAFS